MFLIISAALFLNVLGQKLPDFFEKPDHEYRDYERDGYQQKVRYKEHNLHDQTNKPFTVDTAVFEELDEQLQKHNKYAEFEQFTNQLKEKKRMDPTRTVQDELKEVLAWSRNLDRPQQYRSDPQMQVWGGNIERNVNLSPPRPSPGMDPYWAETEKKKRTYPTPGPNTPSTLTGKHTMNLALRTLEGLDTADKKSPIQRFPEVFKNLPKSVPKEILQDPKMFSTKKNTNLLLSMQDKDDYNSPIRWVSIDSKDTGDGLAKVTNTIFVPVIDYNIERLGLTSTTLRPFLTTDKGMLVTIARTIDFKTVDQRDWLAFETVLGGRNESYECDGDGCQSRCKILACESVCRGDTCASGCIGGFCNTYCKGPGCLSMCIGESCTAKCEGMSCEARCRGTGCEAGCRTFSCSYAINGKYGRGGGTWGEHYPQYDEKNIRHTQYS